MGAEGDGGGEAVKKRKPAKKKAAARTKALVITPAPHCDMDELQERLERAVAAAKSNQPVLIQADELGALLNTLEQQNMALAEHNALANAAATLRSALRNLLSTETG